MQPKLKMCAGFDGNSHEAYIYKNIDGKKYCKSCTHKLRPQKPINKISAKQVFKMKLKTDLLEEDKKFYKKLWSYLPHNCEVCGIDLPNEPNIMFFHHILEKRNYPDLRHTPVNIAIVCPQCHNLYESYPDKVPYLVEYRKRLELIYQKSKNLENE